MQHPDFSNLSLKENNCSFPASVGICQPSCCNSGDFSQHQPKICTVFPEENASVQSLFAQHQPPHPLARSLHHTHTHKTHTHTLTHTLTHTHTHTQYSFLRRRTEKNAKKSLYQVSGPPPCDAFDLLHVDDFAVTLRYSLPNKGSF